MTNIHCRVANASFVPCQKNLTRLFVLTTRSLHWFREHGFLPAGTDALPESKKQMYNYQRRSKVLMLALWRRHPPAALSRPLSALYQQRSAC